MGATRFRGALPSDASALGALHVASWLETYNGILPDELLARLSVDGRAAMWAQTLSDHEGSARSAVWLAEDGQRLVGFGACGAQRDDALAGMGFSGEIEAIYVLRAHQRLGVGRSIISLLAQALLDQGHRAATLWVLRENRAARCFYERVGGVVVGEKKEERLDATLSEVAYGWTDLSGLVR